MATAPAAPPAAPAEAATKAAKAQWRLDNPVASAHEDPTAERADWDIEKLTLAKEPGGFEAAQALLARACMAGDLAGVKRAIASGAKPNARVFCKNKGKVVGPSKTKDRYAATAVHIAARHGKVHVARFLLTCCGVDPDLHDGRKGSANMATSRNYTPCYEACYYRHHDCVRVLIALGATPDHHKGAYHTCPPDVPHPYLCGCPCAKCGNNL